MSNRRKTKTNTSEKSILANFDIWKSTHNKIMGQPIYLINCHACICTSYAQCESAKPVTGYPQFVIPQDTYIQTFTMGGEYTIWSDLKTKKTSELKNDFKRHLLVNSRDDVISYEEGVDATGQPHFNRLTYMDGTFVAKNGEEAAHQYPFVAAAYRAGEGQTYPDIACIFEDAEEELGVIHLDTQTNVNIDRFKKGVSFLSDIIQHIGPGIYILVGCTTPAIVLGMDVNPIYEFEGLIDTYASMIYRNDLMFGNNLPSSEHIRITSRKLDPDPLFIRFHIKDINSQHPVSTYSPILAALTAYRHEKPKATMKEKDVAAEATLIYNTLLHTHKEWTKHPGENFLHYGHRILNKIIIKRGGGRQTRKNKRKLPLMKYKSRKI